MQILGLKPRILKVKIYFFSHKVTTIFETKYHHKKKFLPVITEHVIFTYSQSTKFIGTKVASEDTLGTRSISATFPVPTSGSAALRPATAALRPASAALKSWRIRPGSRSGSRSSPIYRRTIRTRGTTGSTRNLRRLEFICNYYVCIVYPNNHPYISYITTANGLSGWDQKNGNFC